MPWYAWWVLLTGIPITRRLSGGGQVFFLGGGGFIYVLVGVRACVWNDFSGGRVMGTALACPAMRGRVTCVQCTRMDRAFGRIYVWI